MSLCIKFFVGSQVLSTKKKDDKKTNSVSCLQKKIQEIMAITRPSESEKAIKFEMRIFNGTYMYLLSIPQKLQNFKYEHWDFTHSWRLRNNNNFYLNFVESGLLVLVAPNFRNQLRKCQKKNWMFFWRGFARMWVRKKAHCQYVYKSSSVK